MVTLSKIYTRTGDGGQTRLVGGQQVPKDHSRIEAYGTVDELNAIMGQCRVLFAADPQIPADAKTSIDTWFYDVQQTLFDLGASLATRAEDRWQGMPQMSQERIDALEVFMDRHNAELPVLKSFVLPGGAMLEATLHQARTVCRRAERRALSLSREEPVESLAIPYLNRLSDALFVIGRSASHLAGREEVLWKIG